MNKLLISFVIVAAAMAALYCDVIPPAPVKQCKNQHFEGLATRITVDPCGLKKCKLPQNENTTVAIRFKPTERALNLENEVYAIIGPVSLPFVGTTGTSACKDVRFADTDEPAPCPLEPGIEYVYKNQFPIYPLYPLVDLTVRWSLNDGDRQVICFEVPAAIVKARKQKRN